MGFTGNFGAPRVTSVTFGQNSKTEISPKKNARRLLSNTGRKRTVQEFTFDFGARIEVEIHKVWGGLKDLDVPFHRKM